MKINIKIGDKENRRYIILVVFMAILSLLRIYRNSVQYSSSQQGGIWNIMAALFVLIGIISLLQNRHMPKGIMPTLLAYAILIWIHELIHFRSFSVNEIYYFITAPYFVFVLFTFYYNFNGNKSNVLWIIRIAFIAILTMLIYSFLSFRRGTLADLLLADVYYLLCLLPVYMLYEKNEILKTIATIAAGILIVISEKRAALIAFAIFVICQYVIGDQKLNNGGKIKRGISFIAIFVISYFAYRLILNTIGSRMLFRMSVLLDSGGAGRSQIYKMIIEAFKSSTLLEQLFGHGRGSIGQIQGMFQSAAHSDFLHILYVYGIFPFVLFCVFYILCCIEWVKMKKSGYPYASLYLGGLSICIILSLFSTFCVAFGYVTCGAMFLGVVLADWKQYRTFNSYS